MNKRIKMKKMDKDYEEVVGMLEQSIELNEKQLHRYKTEITFVRKQGFREGIYLAVAVQSVVTIVLALIM